MYNKLSTLCSLASLIIVFLFIYSWVLWVEKGTYRTPGLINRAGMDGSHVKVIIGSQLSNPRSLAIDYKSKSLLLHSVSLHLSAHTKEYQSFIFLITNKNYTSFKQTHFHIYLTIVLESLSALLFI